MEFPEIKAADHKIKNIKPFIIFEIYKKTAKSVSIGKEEIEHQC